MRFAMAMVGVFLLAAADIRYNDGADIRAVSLAKAGCAS